ncbi:MAG: DEAD/DEAH box helicase family protein [Desulfosudis oleivorans]|nr:DEAD/DEAH box helicase family protein [Desulfosudis oleivorans]
MDQVSRKGVRPYQDVAINKTLWQFAQGNDRVLLPAWPPARARPSPSSSWSGSCSTARLYKREHVLFLTDRNSLKDQAYRAFSAFSSAERVQIDKDTVAKGQHLVGKVFFANYQSLDEELDGKKVYEHYDPDFFDLVVVDECHRSGFGDWFGVLEHFGGALQLGLTATPRELEEGERALTDEEKRRDTQHYFGDPVFTYSLKQAIEDGYLVPYLLEERITNVDEDGYTGPDGKRYTTANFERDIRMPDRTKAIAEDLWEVLGKYELRDGKTIVFCVDDTHAAFMAQELRRLSGSNDYAARITRAERNSHQLERNFAVVGPSNPRVAITVDLLTTGFDAPDVKNVVFVRPLRSAILYKQMKGRGTRLCEDINKRYFTIFDYSGASQPRGRRVRRPPGQPAEGRCHQQQAARRTPVTTPRQSPSAKGCRWSSRAENRYVVSGRRPQGAVRGIHRSSRASSSSTSAARAWTSCCASGSTRAAVRNCARPCATATSTRRPSGTTSTCPMPMTSTSWPRSASSSLAYPIAPTAPIACGTRTRSGCCDHLGESATCPKAAALQAVVCGKRRSDHYRLFGIDDLEQARTYGAPQFAEQFGSFTTLTAALRRPGAAQGRPRSWLSSTSTCPMAA